MKRRGLGGSVKLVLAFCSHYSGATCAFTLPRSEGFSPCDTPRNSITQRGRCKSLSDVLPRVFFPKSQTDFAMNRASHLL